MLVQRFSHFPGFSTPTSCLPRSCKRAQRLNAIASSIPRRDRWPGVEKQEVIRTVTDVEGKTTKHWVFPNEETKSKTRSLPNFTNRSKKNKTSTFQRLQTSHPPLTLSGQVQQNVGAHLHLESVLDVPCQPLSIRKRLHLVW